jgi:hypothetical protein
MMNPITLGKEPLVTRVTRECEAHTLEFVRKFVETFRSLNLREVAAQAMENFREYSKGCGSTRDFLKIYSPVEIYSPAVGDVFKGTTGRLALAYGGNGQKSKLVDQIALEILSISPDEEYRIGDLLSPLKLESADGATVHLLGQHMSRVAKFCETPREKVTMEGFKDHFDSAYEGGLEVLALRSAIGAWGVDSTVPRRSLSVRHTYGPSSRVSTFGPNHSVPHTFR